MSHEDDFFRRQGAENYLSSAKSKIKRGLIKLNEALELESELESVKADINNADTQLSVAKDKHKRAVLAHDMASVQERVSHDVEAAAQSLINSESGYYAEIYSPRVFFWQHITEWLGNIESIHQQMGSDISAREMLSRDALLMALRRDPKNAIPFAYVVSQHDAAIAKSIGLTRCAHYLANPDLSADAVKTLKALIDQWNNPDSLEIWRKQRSLTILQTLTDYQGGSEPPSALTAAAQSIESALSALPLFMPDAYMMKAGYANDGQSVSAYDDDLLYLLEMYQLKPSDLTITTDGVALMSGPYQFAQHADTPVKGC